MKNLSFESGEILEKEQLKTVFGGYELPDGFDCGPIAYACDDSCGDDDSCFAECMFWESCL